MTICDVLKRFDLLYSLPVILKVNVIELRILEEYKDCGSPSVARISNMVHLKIM
jgi:hypothetical protein